MIGNRFRIIGVAVAVAFLSGCSVGSTTPAPPEHWPTDSWAIGRPEDHNVNPAALQEVVASIPQELPFLDSLLIVRNGVIVHESYYNDFDADTPHDVRSVTKSWTSALIGMARASGRLGQIDAALPDLLPDYFANGNHQDKAGITLEHLLTMRSGIDFDDEAMLTGEYGGIELMAGDVTEFALGFPMAHEPGTAWNYSTLDSQLSSAVFSHVMGESLEEFASDHLFAPLGIENYSWQEDGTGTTMGGGGLFLRPRDMAKLGLLFLHNGQWDGEQIVPADWVELSLTPQNTEAYYAPTDQPEVIEWYGYYWWTWKGEWFFGYRAFQAQGFAGQEILVFPELDLIVVTTANADGISPATGEQQELGVAHLNHDSILPSLVEIDAED